LAFPSKLQWSKCNDQNENCHQGSSEKRTILLDIFKNFSLFVKLPDQIFKLLLNCCSKWQGLRRKLTIVKKHSNFRWRCNGKFTVQSTMACSNWIDPSHHLGKSKLIGN
jgi:hypothetical protein